MISKKEIKGIGYLILSQKDLELLRPNQLRSLLAQSRLNSFDYKKHSPIKTRSVDFHFPITTTNPKKINVFLAGEIYSTLIRMFYLLYIRPTTEILFHVEYERLRWDCVFNVRAYNPHLLFL